MPKQVFKILQFHGGISDNSDPRDIGENQFVALENVAVDEVGKLIVLGDIKTTHFTQAGAMAVPGGRGLMTIKTDYNSFTVNADSASGVGSNPQGGTAIATTGSRKYYITAGSEIVSIKSSDEALDELPMTNMTQASMYWAKGAFRLYDADHKDADVPQWRGLVKGVLYGTDSGDAANAGHVFNNATAAGASAAVDQWYTVGAQIKGCFEPQTINLAGALTGSTVTVGKNLIMGNGLDCLDGVTTTNASPTALFGFANELCGTGTDGDSQPTNMTTASGMYWGLGMHFQEGADGSGSWAPTGNESYQFFCTTIYDGNQESSPQLFTMYPGGYQAHIQNSDDTHGPSDATATNNSYKNATVETSIIFTDGGKGTAKATEVLVHFKPTIKWIHPAHGDTTAETAVIYNFGAVDANGDGDASLRIGGNPRISGLKCYWASSEDGFSDLWELWEWDFVKGFRAANSQGGGSGSFSLVDWTSAHNTTLGSAYHYYQHPHAGPGATSGVSFNDPPKLVRYEDNNGHTSEELVVVDGFKASVLQGGRVWIGNVKIDGVIHGDAMIKSKGGQYDKFPVETNRENIIVDDGDEIVALSEFADRILQFKANTLYIINASGEYVGLESKNAYKGVTNPGAVCRTDYGVAWANAFGCYVYDGQKVIDLLEEGGQRKINKNTWSTHIGTADYHRVGFNPIKRQIIVTAGGSTDAGAYIYDMVTKSWTKSTSLISDANTGSNFINDLDTGDLLIHDSDNNTIDKWVDTPPGAQPQITKVICIADDSDSLNAKYFDITNGTGLTEIWIDTDNSGTSAPSGSGSYADVIEVTQIGTDDSAERVAIAIASAINEDGAPITASVEGDTVLITDSADAPRTLAVDGNTGFTVTTPQVGASSGGGPSISIKTKDIDFGQPSVRKKIYKVYVSYKGDASAVTCTYQTNGDTDAGLNFYKSGATGATTGATDSTTPFHSSTVGTDDWVKAELKPVVSINNINSFQLIFGGTAATDFEINDISIVYRVKNVK